MRRRLTRARMLPFFAKRPRCLVGIKPCNNSHYWARELIALGHDVKLMPAQYLKPCVKRGKNDAADTEAICEAVTRPTMRFVAVKSPEQQSLMMLHKVRLILNRQRAQISNAIHAHISESGVVAPAVVSASNGCSKWSPMQAMIAFRKMHDSASDAGSPTRRGKDRLGSKGPTVDRLTTRGCIGLSYVVARPFSHFERDVGRCSRLSP